MNDQALTATRAAPVDVGVKSGRANAGLEAPEEFEVDAANLQDQEGLGAVDVDRLLHQLAQEVRLLLGDLRDCRGDPAERLERERAIGAKYDADGAYGFACVWAVSAVVLAMAWCMSSFAKPPTP